MVNHPNRSTASFQFIAFSTVTGDSLARAATASEALEKALHDHHLDDDAFLEVLNCGDNARKVWDRRLSLSKARSANLTVFRGAGYDHLPAVSL